ncbi:family 11 glycoside hydrolase, partial [Piromyces sp. E2]
KIIQLILSTATYYVANAQSFCSSAKHSGQSVKETSNKVGSISGIGYELWADSGSNSATFYSDGSFSCSFQNAKDYLCRSGLSFDSTKTHDQIGHMYADFKLVKQNIHNVDYSYVGIYGWSRSPLVEFYVVDNWLSQYRPGDWVGNKKHGDFTIDGAQYTVFENDRFGPSIDGDTNFKQFFSIRKEARDCGTIDITAHFQQWEKLGMKLGKMHEAKVLGEAGSNGAGTSGTADFPYAKVYIGQGNGGGSSGGNDNRGNNGNNNNNNNNNNSNNNNNNSNSGNTSNATASDKCPATILKQGYKCCAEGCTVYYTDVDGDWGVEDGEWCGCGNRKTSSSSGTCPSKILTLGYKCCAPNCVIYYTDDDGDWGVENGEWCGCGGGEGTPPANDKPAQTSANPPSATSSNFCSSAKHSGQSVKETSNKVGSISGIGYELWADSGSNSATFYSDGSFSCSFQNAKDYLCRSGLSFDSTKTHDQIGHMYADFKLVKQNIQNVDYSYVGIYGWSRSPLVEFYVVDNWLSQWRPGDWVGNKKHGDFTIDGAQYTVFENDRFGPSIDGDTNFKQFFSIRKEPRDCGTIDITAHFQQWEKLGMKLGKMHEAKVLGEAGSNGAGTSGTADFPYAKVYI